MIGALVRGDVRQLFKGIGMVHVGRPTKPDPGPLLATDTALVAVLPDSLFTASSSRYDQLRRRHVDGAEGPRPVR